MVKSEEDWKRNSKCFIFYYIYYWCLLLWWNCIKYIDPIYEFVRWLSLKHSGDVSCSDLFTQDIKSDQLLYSEIHLHLSLLACMTLVQAHWKSILYTILSHILLYVVVCSKHLWINATGVAKHEYTINSFKFNILGRKIRILIMKYKTRDCVWTANAWIFHSPWCANVKTSAELLQFIMSWTLENVVY